MTGASSVHSQDAEGWEAVSFVVRAVSDVVGQASCFSCFFVLEE